MLDGGQGDRRKLLADGLEQERILAVLNAGDDPLPGRGRGIGRTLVRVVVLVPGPVPRYRIDAEAEDLLVRPAAQPLVEARDRSPGAVGHADDLALRVRRRRAPHVHLLVSGRPLERRLQVEALALALLFVRRDPVGWLGSHVLDPVRVPHHVGVAERLIAGVTHRQVVAEVSRAAVRADAHGLGGQLRVGRRRFPVAKREQRPHDTVGAPLVVHETAGAELGKGDEARTLQVRLAPATVSTRRDVGEQREPREVVPRQKALRGEVAVGVEVARKRLRATLEQVELVHRLRVPDLRRPLVTVGRGVVVHGPARSVPLLLGGGEEVPPPIESRREAPGRLRHSGIRVGVPAGVPGRQFGSQIVRDQVEDVPNPLTRPVRDAAVREFRLDVRIDRTALVGKDEQLGDGRVERLVDAREPDRLQMAVDQVPVREFENGRPYLAVHHRLGVAEEVLVVRALRRRVRENQGRLSAAPRSSAALSVVRRRGRHVAHVDRVQRRDVDTEFHRRGAEEHRQKAIGFAGLSEPLVVGLQLLAFTIAEAETLLPDLPVVRVDLGGVLARLEAEERMGRSAQHRRQVLVEVAEERVAPGTTAILVCIAGPEEDAGIVQPPPGLVERSALFRHETMRRGGAKKILDEPVDLLRLEVADGPVAAPERGRAQLSAETAPRAAAHDQVHVAERARPATRRDDHQPAAALRLFVEAQPPRES